MPSPELPHGEGGPEQQPVPYYKAARFASERPAARTYERLQETLYQTSQTDLSVYRLFLDRVSHVAVLGQPPPEALDRRITRVLSRGEAVSLPLEVLQALAERRREQIRAGTWVEQHHRPGE